jgi:membrane protease YdiL (CAAX protease family)
MDMMMPDATGWLLISFAILYLAYWLPVESATIARWFRNRWGAHKGALGWFIWNKSHGAVLFGIVFTVVALLVFPDIPFERYGLRLPQDGLSYLIAIGVTALLGTISWIKNRKLAKQGASFGRYPEIALDQWHVATIMVDSVMWMLYLLGYEMMFRGVLLGALSSQLGLGAAVGINVALYAIVHIPKGAQEAVGALVLGYVLCMITVASGSILTAWSAHCALAIVNDVSAFAYRKDMHLVSSVRKSKAGGPR